MKRKAPGIASSSAAADVDLRSDWNRRAMARGDNKCRRCDWWCDRTSLKIKQRYPGDVRNIKEARKNIRRQLLCQNLCWWNILAIKLCLHVVKYIRISTFRISRFSEMTSLFGEVDGRGPGSVLDNTSLKRSRQEDLDRPPCRQM